MIMHYYDKYWDVKVGEREGNGVKEMGKDRETKG